MSEKITQYNGSLVDIVIRETGEVINKDECLITVTELFEEDKDMSSDTSEFFQTDITFIKSFQGNGIELNNRLSNAEIAAVVFLCDFICYEDCVLRTGGNRKGNALSVKELAGLRGISYETFRKTLGELKKKQVIGYHSTGDTSNNTCIRWITVNPYIFCRGRKVESWVIDFYKDTIWAQTVRQHVKDNIPIDARGDSDTKK